MKPILTPEEIQQLYKANILFLLSLEKKEEKKEEVEIDYELSENERIIVESLKDSLPQLAPHLTFVLSCLLGKVSTLLIGPKASGKSKSIKIALNSLSKHLPTKLVDKVDMKFVKELEQYTNINNKRLDNYSLNTNTDKQLKEYYEIEKVNTALVVGIDDVSHFVFNESNEGRLIFTVLASLAQTGRYIGDGIKIENLNTVFAGGVVGNAFKALQSDNIWEAMVADRFVRYYILYYNRPEPKKILGDAEFPEIKLDNISVRAEFDDSLNVRLSREMLSTQISFERTDYLVKNILKGHAMLRGDEVVTQDDIDWLSLYELPIKLEYIINSVAMMRESFDHKVLELIHNALKWNMPLMKAAQITRVPIDVAIMTERGLKKMFRGDFLHCSPVLKLKKLMEVYS